MVLARFCLLRNARERRMASMFGKITHMLLSQSDQKLADEFLPKLEAEFNRVDGQMGWGYPDELSDHVGELRDAFE